MDSDTPSLYRLGISSLRRSRSRLEALIGHNRHYPYRPLKKPGNIRLLVLQPAEKLTDPLIGALEEVGLEHVPYTALSYSWAVDHAEADRLPGQPSQHSLATKLLLLDGIKVLIGENLFDALRRLREKSNSPSRLWVDAVCIDQGDHVEKSTQVSMMGSIYSTAAQVVAWLGEGEEQSNRAAKVALQCLRAEQTQQDQHQNTGTQLNPPYWYYVHSWHPEHCLEAGLPFSPREACRYCCDRDEFSTPLYQQTTIQALFKLSQTRYFSRLWVVQEVSVPQVGRLRFQWGAYSLPGSPLELIRDRWAIDLYSVRPRYTWTRSPHNPLSSRRSLVGWVVYGQFKACSNPRDKLYAVLSCPTRTPGSTILPDYAFSVEEVYLQLARYLLADHDIVSVLWNSYGRTSGRLDGLPTWVPDLSVHFSQPSWSEDPNAKPAAWDFTQPNLSEDNNQILSCCLCYLGTIYLKTDESHGKLKIEMMAVLRDLSAYVGNGSIFMFDEGRAIIAQRMGDDSIRTYAGLRQSEDWKDSCGIDWSDHDAARKAVVERCFNDCSPDLKHVILESKDELVVRPLFMLPVGITWEHRAGVTLIGDAAHLMTPFAGVGVNLAMTDALMLARALALRKDGLADGTLDAAVKSYEQLMFENAKGMAERTARGLEGHFSASGAKDRGQKMRDHYKEQTGRSLSDDYFNNT